MQCLKDNGFEFVRSCSLVWAQAFKQLVDAFSSYAYVRHFWMGAGLEWWVGTISETYTVNLKMVPFQCCWTIFLVFHHLTCLLKEFRSKRLCSVFGKNALDAYNAILDGAQV